MYFTNAVLDDCRIFHIDSSEWFAKFDLNGTLNFVSTIVLQPPESYFQHISRSLRHAHLLHLSLSLPLQAR